MDHSDSSTVSMDYSSNNDSNYDSSSYDYVYEYPYSTVWLAIVPFICSLVIAVIIVGNLMVIAAYFRDHRIRANVANLFILNLAITDFIVGTCMWPISLSWLIKDTWVHGEIFCKLWLIVDFTVTMVSALTLAMISWDRYCLLTKGMRYHTFQTKKRIGMILFVTWTSVLTWYSILEFAWTPITGQRNIDYAHDCEMEFTASLAITLLANVLEFFIPFTVLVTLNAAVYMNIKRRSRGVISPSPPNNPSTRSTARGQDGTNGTLRQGATCHSGGVAINEQRKVAHSSIVTVETVAGSIGCQTDGNLPSRIQVANDSKAEGLSFARHRKAAVVLGILVGFFLVCWIPIQITSVMFAICGNDCVSYVNWEVTNALVWGNSMINPFIYAATNKHFRRNFRQFLFLDRWGCAIRICEVTR